QAASRDVILRKKGERSTVSVFDGTAVVRAAGQSVQVNSGQGAAVKKNTPPTPARPLPDAPVLTRRDGVVWSFGVSAATLRSEWQAVPNSVAYRVELARD